MAILLRSVRRDGEAIMAAMEDAGVPYVVTGMDNLFQTNEAEAARQLFYFLADEIDEATLGAAYRGGLEDERRLFYVAVTRAQTFLHMSWAPHAGNQTARAPSDFFNEVLASKYVKRRAPDYGARKRLESRPKSSVANVTLSFSDLKSLLSGSLRVILQVRPAI